MPSQSANRSFWPAFQKRWAALLCEQTDDLRPWSEAMARALARGVIEVPHSGEAHAALSLLNARLARLENARNYKFGAAPSADGATLDDVTLQHFVRYGAAILSAPCDNCSHETEARPLDYAQLHLLISDLCDWLRALKLVPRRVFCLGDSDAQIIGRAIACVLGVEAEVADGDGFTRSKSLIVSADSRLLTATPLRTIFPSQVLYALNLHRESGTIAPDIASRACADLLLPWHGEYLSTRKVNDIVTRIAKAAAQAETNLNAVEQTQTDQGQRLNFYRAQKAHLSAGNSSFNRLLMLPEIT